MTSICIITATTGGPHLRHAIESVQQQKVDDSVELSHIVVADGPEYAETVQNIVKDMDTTNVPVHVFQLPFNTGGNGYLCHRIYGAVPMLVNTDFISFLDDDTIMERTHVQTLYNAIRDKGTRWGYTLRTIVDETNTEICKDMCESLGMIRPTCVSNMDRLIDTNCYMFSRDLAVQLAPLWHKKTRSAKNPGELEADRHIAQTLIQSEPSGACTRQFTIRYRAGNRDDSVKGDFFEKGNESVGSIDFEKNDIYVFFHMDTDTERILNTESRNTLLSTLRETYNVFDGYKCIRGLPSDARIVCVMSDPFQYLETLRQMKQSTHPSMKRIVVLTKDIQLPKDFSPVYADTVIQSFGLDFDVACIERPNKICVDDTIPQDHDLRGLATTEFQNAIFKIVPVDAVEQGWTQGYVPLAWKGDVPVKDDLANLEGSSWIDLSRAIEYCEKQGIDGSRNDKIRSFLQMNHYINDDIAKTMHERILNPIRTAVQKVIDTIQ